MFYTARHYQYPLSCLTCSGKFVKVCFFYNFSFPISPRWKLLLLALANVSAPCTVYTLCWSLTWSPCLVEKECIRVVHNFSVRCILWTLSLNEGNLSFFFFFLGLPYKPPIPVFHFSLIYAQTHIFFLIFMGDHLQYFFFSFCAVFMPDHLVFFFSLLYLRAVNYSFLLFSCIYVRAITPSVSRPPLNWEFILLDFQTCK